ncbi:MAG TPA: enoyl-CoA hydratase/isomerase family protein [Caldithrix abyssi]|uniref:Enoyl-CoA hydratase/isomerase family protein n=1 Tax=Caldithrix abyssi TaxID=187145 RepID=A0A7V5VFM6_CALAY|nr:enoyl-CoA hydratase/isomerase family protein [Caldithrix abyssi]
MCGNDTSMIQINRVKPHAELILDRPDKFNALNSGMMKRLQEALAELEGDDDTRCVVLKSSSSGAFCSGVDLRELAGFTSVEQARNFALLLDETLLKLLKFPKPVIARLHGFVYGGGFALASVCDIRLVAPDTKIAFPAGRLGAILPPALTFMLNALTGLGNTRELLLTGRSVKAREALELGLVQYLLPPAEMEKKIHYLIGELCKSTDTALAMTKKISNHPLIAAIEQSNLTAAENFAYLAATPEWQQRLSNFVKRNKS